MEAAGEPAVASAKNPYRQILKSSALIGGSSAVNIVMGIVRTKATAVLLGPAGFGLMSLYGSIAEVAIAIAGMGVNSSGVRQIAEAVGSRETQRIARTTAVLRRVTMGLGVVGMAALILSSRQISNLTFGSDRYASAVALLSLMVFFRLVSGSQAALIQGMHRVSDLARMRVLGAVFATVISIPLVYLFRERGIVPSLLAAAGMTVLTSWWFSRKIEIPRVHVTRSDLREEGIRLLKLGLAFMVSGFLTMGAAYAVRLIVIRHLGLAAAGLYQSAWVLGGLYVGFILQAMGTDLYPRLTAISADDEKCNRLVNEQTLISMLLAGPGVIATLTLAPLVIALFYSAEFGPAADLLRWICLGMILRVVAFPIGYIVLAKGYQNIFFWNEVTVTVVHVAVAWLLVPRLGLTGAAIAFVVSCLWHSAFIYVVVHRRTGFRWSMTNHRLASVFLPLIALVFCGFHVLPFALATAFGVCCAAFTGAYAFKTLLRLVSPERLERMLPAWLR